MLTEPGRMAPELHPTRSHEPEDRAGRHRRWVHSLIVLIGLFVLMLLVGGAIATLDVAGPGGLAQEPEPRTFMGQLLAAAVERTTHDVRYDGSYRRIAYPGGDVPDSLGVCTDVIIRAYRAVGIDLQRQVHEDMVPHFDDYPAHWGLERPDRNIDHRRVPNLQTFFRRQGAELPITDDPLDYRPGDLVTWTVPPHLPHIGIVIDRRTRDGRRPLIVHNIGRGPEVEDVLFRFPITGHYRYEPRAHERRGS